MSRALTPVALIFLTEARGLDIGMAFQHSSLFETLFVVRKYLADRARRQAELAARIRNLGHECGVEVEPDAPYRPAQA